LSRSDVRVELALSAEQASAAEQMMSQLYVRAAALRGKTGLDVLTARRAIDAAEQQWIETQLTDAQRTRLVQIDLQWEGPAALVTRPILADSLGLSSAQKQSLSRAVAEVSRKRAQGQYQPSDERNLAELALSLMNADQKARWKAMLGRPFVPQVAASPGRPTR